MAKIIKNAAPEMLVDSIIPPGNDNDDNNSMEILPNEILALIFKMLSVKERLKV